MINFYNTDNIRFMKTKADNYYDLAIADPPYGIGLVRTEKGNRGIRNKKTSNDTLGWDSESPPIEYFNELFRVSKEQIIFGANNFISKMPYDTTCWIIWDCMNGDNYFADFQMAWTSFKTACRFIKISQRFPKNEDIAKRIHDTQKPVNLYREILNKYAKKEHKILDPNGGSASISIACEMGGYENLDICEKDEIMHKKAVIRYNNFKSQKTLF